MDKNSFKSFFTFRKVTIILLGILCVGTVVTSVLLMGRKSDVIVVSPSESSSYLKSESITKSNSSALMANAEIGNNKSTTVSRKKSTTTVKAQAVESNSEDEKVTQFPADINKVTKDDLIQIDGIGDVTAQKIIDFRNECGVIHSISSLSEINGIGEKTVEKLESYLYVADNFTTTTAEQINDEVSYSEENKQTTTTTVDYNTVNTQQQNVTEQTHSSTTTTTTQAPERCKVNINTANKDEIARCLLIDDKVAQSIVEVRGQISKYTNTLELLYAEGMSNNLYNEIVDYVIL